MAAPAATTSTAPASAAAAPAPAAPPQPVTQQLAAPLLNLRASGDGTHRILINLHPNDLGSVNVEVRFSNGNISVAMSSGSEATRAAITAALPGLHQQLTDAGMSDIKLAVNAGAFDSTGGGAASGQRGQEQSAAAQDQPARTPNSSATAAGSVSTEDETELAPSRQLSTSGTDRWL
jgi:flagellar hook-length control protein FliK